MEAPGDSYDSPGAAICTDLLLHSDQEPASFSWYQPPSHIQDLPSTAIAVGVPPGHDKASGWKADEEAGICYLRLLRKEVKLAMTKKEVSGVIEIRPQVFNECPDYVCLGLRTNNSQFVEIFLPTSLVAKKLTQYQLGQRLNLAGGEWYIELDATGVGEYLRYWPNTVRYDA